MGERIALAASQALEIGDLAPDQPTQDLRERNYRKKLTEATVRKLTCVLSIGAIALAPPSYLKAYDWPIKPFNQQHAIRGAFDDPRIDNHNIDNPHLGTFHFGVDIAAPDGTAVYAVDRGRIYLDSPTAVAEIVKWNGLNDSLIFGYWHIDPVVYDGEAVTKHQLLGHVLKGSEHVHFAETLNGQYVNPLKEGRLTPYRVNAEPVIKSLMLWQHGKYFYSDKTPLVLSGQDDLVVNAFDPTPIAPLAPWNKAILTPSVISWQLANERGKVVIAKPDMVDFRDQFYTGLLSDVYAPETRQNHPRRPGNYNFWLIRGFDTFSLANGSYDLEVTASDIRGNSTSRSFELEIANPWLAHA